jgi:hypothetical protein
MDEKIEAARFEAGILRSLNEARGAIERALTKEAHF